MQHVPHWQRGHGCEEENTKGSGWITALLSALITKSRQFLNTSVYIKHSEAPPNTAHLYSLCVTNHLTMNTLQKYFLWWQRHYWYLFQTYFIHYITSVLCIAQTHCLKCKCSKEQVYRGHENCLSFCCEVGVVILTSVGESIYSPTIHSDQSVWGNLLFKSIYTITKCFFKWNDSITWIMENTFWIEAW